MAASENIRFTKGLMLNIQSHFIFFLILGVMVIFRVKHVRGKSLTSISSSDTL